MLSDLDTAYMGLIADGHPAMYKARETAGCEIPVGPTLARHGDIRIPDLMVSRNSRPDVILEHGGYAIDRQGKLPDFVLEVASKTTGVIDYTDKRADRAEAELRRLRERLSALGDETNDS